MSHLLTSPDQISAEREELNARATLPARPETVPAAERAARVDASREFDPAAAEHYAQEAASLATAGADVLRPPSEVTPPVAPAESVEVMHPVKAVRHMGNVIVNELRPGVLRRAGVIE